MKFYSASHIFLNLADWLYCADYRIDKMLLYFLLSGVKIYETFYLEWNLSEGNPTESFRFFRTIFNFFSCKWSIGRVYWWIVVPVEEKSTSMNQEMKDPLLTTMSLLLTFLLSTPTESRSQNSQPEKPQLLTSLTTIQLFVDLANHFKLCTIINRGKRVEIKFHILRTVVNQVTMQLLNFSN